MLEMIRKGASTWTARALLAILALSFVYWGADTRSTRSDFAVVAKVGNQSITQAEIERALELEINAISQRAGRRITPTEARAFGLDRRVLTRLVGTAALDQRANSLGLGLSEETVAENIKRDPAFRGLDGKFDRQGFDQIVRSIGMREREFLALRRREDTRDQLTQSVLSAIVTPKPLLDAVHNWREETRIIEHFSIDGEKAVTVAEPDAGKLKDTYEANKTQFMAPEYRRLNALMLAVDDLKTRMPLTDAEIATNYDETKESFATPERRRVQQLTFKDKAAAEAAKTAIDGGKNFMTVAQELGLKDSDVELGLVTKKALIDPKIADAAFKLEKDKVSGVVEGKFSSVLLRVPEISAGKQPTLDDVKDKIRDKLQREKARAEVRKLRDQVDDLRTAGKSEKEIADAMTLKLVDIAEADSANKTKDGKPAFEHPDASKIIAAGFDARTGVDREPVELADGGLAWVNTLATTPSRQKTFEEVEADVKSLYVTNERTRLLRELAQKLADRLSTGEPIDTVAAEVGAKAEKTLPITRNTSPQGLSEAGVRQAFSIAKGKAAHAEGADRKTRSVLRVADVKAAEPPTKDQVERLTAEVGQQFQIDTLDAFINAVQEAAGVTINEAELKRSAGSAVP